MLKQNDITKMLTKLNEIAEIINHNTETETQSDYTPGKSEPITYLTAIIRNKVKHGWQPIPNENINFNQIIQATIQDGNMHIITTPDKYTNKLYKVNNVTIPEPLNQPTIPEKSGKSNMFEPKKLIISKGLIESDTFTTSKGSFHFTKETN